ncbi:MAG: hypothetical protein DMG32_00300 [Acidobacteria bacterium]|nr:MAG: hypothetical protein DMG32_00300 [Acidobacteriota bacterium]
MLKQWIAFSFLVITSPLLVAQTPPPGAQQAGGPGAPRQATADWQRKHDMALKYRSLADFYAALTKEAASKPKASLPDWTGIWTADRADSFGACLGGSQCYFRPGPGGVAPKLTPVAMAELKSGEEKTAKGLIYDENLSTCGPAGFPRWLTEPFLREQIVTPDQTYLLTEQANEIRRIYTDGRGHTPEADRYPLPEGDSIGFWDGQKLVIHTNQLQSRPMGRNQPMQSEKMETVEIWEKVDANTIAVDVWLFDPRLYLEPWYVQRRYTQVPNPDKSMRIRYWDCSENPNNDVTKTQDGGTDFKGFTFTDKSKNQPNH